LFAFTEADELKPRLEVCVTNGSVFITDAAFSPCTTFKPSLYKAQIKLKMKCISPTLPYAMSIKRQAVHILIGCMLEDCRHITD